MAYDSIIQRQGWSMPTVRNNERQPDWLGNSKRTEDNLSNTNILEAVA